MRAAWRYLGIGWVTVMSACADSAGPPPRVATVKIHPDSIVVHVDSTVVVNAEVLDENGRPVVGHAIGWLVFDTSAVRVSEGRLTGLRVGPAEVIAASESVLARAPIAVVVRLRALAMGSRGACAVSADNNAYCWGIRVGFPQRVLGLPPIRAAFAGLDHQCALAITNAAFCWGFEALGDGGDTASATPVAVVGGLSFATLSLGWYHTCGLTNGTGAVYCWGPTAFGGTGTTQRVDAPRAITLPAPAVSLAVGANQTCAVVQGGAAYCWGSNRYGELGSAVNENVCVDVCSTTPTRVDSVPPLLSVHAGYEHTCGLTADGVAYCWGVNYSGQLGAPGGSGCAFSRTRDTTLVCSEVPLAVSGGLRFTTIIAGEEDTCGLTSGGALYCWGGNYVGEFGNGDRGAGSATPVPAGGSLHFQSVTASELGTCGMAAGVGYCWGSDWFNTLGNGPPRDQNSATPVRILYQP